MDGNTQNTLITENIYTNKVTTFGKHNCTIQTLLYDEVTQSLLAGDNNGWIKQYSRRNGNNHFSLVKDYIKFDFRSFFSSEKVDGIAFFGGLTKSIHVIDIFKRRAYQNIMRSRFNSTLSLKVCHAPENKVYLSVGGSRLGSHLNGLEFLDVSMVYGRPKMNENQDAPKVNKMLTALHSKDASIKRRYSHSPPDKTTTKGTLNKKRYKKQ